MPIFPINSNNEFGFLKRIANSDRYKADTLFESYDNFIMHIIGLSDALNGKFEKAYSILLKKAQEADENENKNKNKTDSEGNDITEDLTKPDLLEHLKKQLLSRKLSFEKEYESSFFAYFIAYELNISQQILILKWFIIWRIDGFNEVGRLLNNSLNRELCPTALKLYYSLIKELNTVMPVFSFEKVKADIDLLESSNEKIKFLLEITTTFKQQYSQFDNDDYFSRHEPNFLKQCELEIEKLKQLAQFEKQTETAKNLSKFILSKSKGNKADFIRILEALYQLRFFQTLEGQLPTKETFMKQVGIFFGADFSDYDKDRSQALNASIESNLKIFHEMINIIQKAHIDKESK